MDIHLTLSITPESRRFVKQALKELIEEFDLYPSKVTPLVEDAEEQEVQQAMVAEVMDISNEELMRLGQELLNKDGGKAKLIDILKTYHLSRLTDAEQEHRQEIVIYLKNCIGYEQEA